MKNADDVRVDARVGYVSALACAVLSLVYVAGQLLEWAGLLGSAGGPGSTSTMVGIVVLLTPSLLLGSAFVVLSASMHRHVPPERRLWTQVGYGFAIAYLVLTGMTYFVQLTLVGPRLGRGDVAGLEPFLFVPFESFLYAVDLLGYSFMSMATLFSALAFERTGREGTARRFMLANAGIMPFLVLQMYWPAAIWVASLWALTFPGAAISLARVFRRRTA